MKIEYVACDYCGTNNSGNVYKYTHSLNLPEPLQIVRCPNCSLVYLNPRLALDELREMYEDGEFYRDYQKRVAIYSHHYPKTYQAIEDYKPEKGNLLELGCATGEFLKAGLDRGWEVAGLDVSPSLAKIAKDSWGVDVIVASSIEEARIPDASFDVVYASHVVEHLPSPTNILSDIYRILKPTGLLIVQVPNEFEDLVYVLFRWLATNRFKRSGADIVDHTYFFTPQTLKLMIEKVGFKTLDISTWRERNQRGFLMSRYPGGRFVKKWLFRVGGEIDRGPNIEIIASKP